ncbi:MAG: PepSY-associated TM helix domain-containing protein [Bacteroidales bacterium]|jgi:hypothetical protein|nr:PepSY-associated TM helix domain-containing protein [Bacteroidales bacterium]
MKYLISPAWRNRIRILHRDLGFVMVGVCLIYGISGILMNHIESGDPAYRTEKGNTAFPPNLSGETLTSAWQAREELPELKKALDAAGGRYTLMLQGGSGVYDPQTGVAAFEISKRRPLIYWMTQLHYNHVKGWSVMGDVFAGALLFFAVSGLLIVPGKAGITGRGKWYLLLGLLIPILYILLSVK